MLDTEFPYELQTKKKEYMKKQSHIANCKKMQDNMIEWEKLVNK